MSINVNVVGATNITTSIANQEIVQVGVGTVVAQAITGLLVEGGLNVTVTTSSGVFTISSVTPPVSSVMGRTGAVVVTRTELGAAAASHTHQFINITDFDQGVREKQSVHSVAGRTGTITLTTADIGGYISPPVSSVAGRTGTVTLTTADISGYISPPVSSVAGRTGTVTLTTADISDYISPPVSSVNGNTGTVVLTAVDITAADATHEHSYVQSLNSLTGTLNIIAGSGVTVSTAGSSITLTAGSGGTAAGGGIAMSYLFG